MTTGVQWWDTTRAVIGMAMMVATVPAFGGASAEMYRRRGEAMIRVRMPAVVIIMNALLSVFNFILGARLYFGLDELPCGYVSDPRRARASAVRPAFRVR